MTVKTISKAEFKAFGKESRKLIKRFMLSETPLKVNDNSIFSKEDILSAVVTAAINVDFLEGSTILNRALWECPTADDVFYHLKKIEKRGVLDDLNDALVKTVRFYRSRKFFPPRVNCAIDTHDIPYYGDKKRSFVRGTKEKAGTNYAVCFITLNIVENGRRLTVAALPYLPLDDKTELVKRLITIARKVISIDVLFMDKGFPSVEMLQMLDRLKVKYLMATQRWKGVKKILKGKRKFPLIAEYEMKGTGKSAKTTLFAVEKVDGDKKLRFCFITNMKIDSSRDALNLAELFRNRWGIETSYRVKKEFRAKTTSNAYVVRLLFFLYSVLLYNIWVLCNALDLENVTFLGGKASAKHLKAVVFLTYCGFFGD